MRRRQFLAASLATSALALTHEAGVAQAAPASEREFYLMRRYDLGSGPESKLTESYFSGALIPALGRMGLGPVGAFRLDYGQQTPAHYLLIPGASIQTLAELELRLADDADFMKAADPFWNATAASPPFQRVEASLMIAFEGWPKLKLPASSANKSKRIFQLRTYESPSNGEHVRKVEMFHSGEFEIFLKSGMTPVFFGDKLIGSHLPNLTYMLCFSELGELDQKWITFRASPEWTKLSSNPRYAFDSIVTNIGNLVLSPLDCSQI